MSLTESIILNHGKDGNNSILKCTDFLIDDGEAYSVIKYFDDKDLKELDLNGVVIAIDHDTPASSSEASEKQKKLLEFSKKHQIKVYNGTGIGAMLLIEERVEKGSVVLGCDYDIAAVGAKGALGLKVKPSEMAEAIINRLIEIEMPEVFTVELTGKLNEGIASKDVILTVIKEIKNKDLKGKVIEFIGEGVRNLTDDDYITLCSLAGKTSALSAIVNLTTESVESDFKYDLGQIQSMVVLPDSYDVISPVAEFENEVKVKEVFLGGTSGGKISDLRVAANLLKGKKISRGLRMIIAPCTSNVYIQMIQEDLLNIFIDAGCIIMNQGYSVDFGKSQGILDAGEVLVSAGDNNDKEMTGGKDSKIYIVSSFTATNTAISGYLKKDNKEA